METRRLALLLELSRLGSMRAVAQEQGLTTSTVSQQLAALAREVGTPLLEPTGRQVRLTPAGRRMAAQGAAVLAAVEAALASVDPASEPAGTVRVAGFATAVRRSLLPVVDTLAERFPAVDLAIREHEPLEAIALLATDDVDLALTYDYDVAPLARDQDHAPYDVVPLWSAPWGLAVPASNHTVTRGELGDAVGIGEFHGRDWIVNSRDQADEHVVRVLASAAGFEPRVRHRAESLDLFGDLIAAGQGIGLLPLDQPVRPDLLVLPLRTPVLLRAYAVTVPGRGVWPPLKLVLDLLDPSGAGPRDRSAR